MRVLTFAAALSLGITVPALATASDSDKDSDGSEIVCKYQAKTGTRFAKKTCRTKAQWEALYQKSRRDAEENLVKPTIDISRAAPGSG